jgi:NAD(P)H-hydrate epimerase
LSGIVGGLMAQGLDLDRAATLGVCLHAHAGDIAAMEKGERGLLASDVLSHIRLLVNNKAQPINED